MNRPVNVFPYSHYCKILHHSKHSLCYIYGKFVMKGFLCMYYSGSNYLEEVGECQIYTSCVVKSGHNFGHGSMHNPLICRQLWKTFIIEFSCCSLPNFGGKHNFLKFFWESQICYRFYTMFVKQQPDPLLLNERWVNMVVQKLLLHSGRCSPTRGSSRSHLNVSPSVCCDPHTLSAVQFTFL